MEWTDRLVFFMRQYWLEEGEKNRQPKKMPVPMLGFVEQSAAPANSSLPVRQGQ